MTSPSEPHTLASVTPADLLARSTHSWLGHDPGIAARAVALRSQMGHVVRVWHRHMGVPSVTGAEPCGCRQCQLVVDTLNKYDDLHKGWADELVRLTKQPRENTT